MLVVLLAIAVWLSRRPSTAIRSGPATTANNEAPSETREKGIAAVPHTNIDATTVATANDVSPAQKGSQELWNTANTLANVPIVFYGKVEDQFGNALVATIDFSVHKYNGYNGSIENGQTVSDQNGFFTISGYSGESLSVKPIKPGYSVSSQNGGGTYSHMAPDEERTHPDVRNPVIVKMWKLQGAEPLTQINQRYKLPYSDAPIAFDLITGKVVPGNGDIKITVNRSSGTLSLRNPGDWSLKIEAVDGGLMESYGTERVTYWAPETGYDSDKLFLFSTNSSQKWADGFTKGFFIMSRHGHIYSKLGMSFSINRDPGDFIEVKFVGISNTNGSRNWEGDPNTLKP